jgi:hypothetical protein
MRAEQPFWARTFARMQPYWSEYSCTEGHPSYSPWMAALTNTGSNCNHSHIHDDEGETRQQPNRLERFGEVPSRPPLLSPQRAAALDAALRPGGLPQPPAGLVDATGARRCVCCDAGARLSCFGE